MNRKGIAFRLKGRFRFLAKYLLKYSRFFGQLILGLLIGSLLQLIFPFLTQAVVDTGIQGKDIHFIWLILDGSNDASFQPYSHRFYPS